MSREFPILKPGETHFWDMESNNDTFEGLKVPNISVIHTRVWGCFYDVAQIDIYPEFEEFLWNTFENNIPVDETQAFLRDNFNIRIDIYKSVLDKNKTRLDEIRITRRQKLMDDIEQAKHYRNIAKTPEEIKYAESVSKCKLMIVSRTQKEYREKTEQDINLNGNLASIIIAPKED